MCLCVQLLGQLENTGPPPAEKEKISSLPTVSITQEQAGESYLPRSLSPGWSHPSSRP